MSKENRNFAEKFKSAFENNDFGEVASIFNDWNKSGNKDANYYYAKALIFSRTQGMTLDDAYNEFETAQGLEADDESLKSWFKSNSWKFVKMKANEEGKLKTIYI